MRWRSGLFVVAGVFAVGIAAAWLAVDAVDLPPRTVAGRIAAVDGARHPNLVGARDWLAERLQTADRGAARNTASRLPLVTVGAQASAERATTSADRERPVASVDAARRAIDTARAGDAIVFAPGTYRIAGTGFSARAAGTEVQPIVVRAELPGSVQIEIDAVQGFVVSGPHWTFENLALRGVCADDGACEHAFHVVGGAEGFVARNNTVVDFNAHFKINGEGGRYPDGGRIEGNTLTATRPRATGNPVTDIDLVAASGWRVRGNLVTDFVKTGGNGVSYGAFFKGGGTDNRFERNIVLCESRLKGAAGARVGLSLGGGGTDPGSCRDGRCAVEQDGGVLDSNLLAGCSDDGVYLNRAARSVLVHNTLVDTGGIAVRFPESSAAVEGNLVDGTVRSRDGGALHAADNLDASLARLYLGSHPVRELFADAAAFDFAWRGAAPRRAAPAAVPPSAIDLCGARRAEKPAYGAFESFADCRRAGGGRPPGA